MSMNTTPILHLNLPPFDSAPWDEDVNDNFLMLDGAIAQVFGVANFAGLWRNSTTFLQGQQVLDQSDSSLWLCATTHTSLALPATFADERTAQPTWWQQVGFSAADYAQAAADSAASAATSNASAQQASASAQQSATAADGSAQAAANELSAAVLKAGGTMTGPLVLSQDPTSNLMAATKEYVDARVGGVGFVKTTGDTMTGPLVIPTPTASGQAANKGYVDTAVGNYLPLVGGTLSGNLVFSGGNQYLTNGTAFISDANYFQFRFSSDNWRFLYQRNSGALFYQNAAGTNLFTINGGGDTTALGTVYGAAVYSYGSVDGNYVNSRGNANVGGSLDVGDFHSRGNINSAGYVWSMNGRVISQTNGMAVVTCYDTRGYAGGIGYATGTLYLGSTDGSGNWGTTYAYVNANGLYVNGSGPSTRITSDASWMYYFWGSDFRWQWNNSNGSIGYYSPWITSFAMLLDAYGSMTVAANAYKPGGGSWTAISDARVKAVVRDYDDSGLADLLQLQPVWYKYTAASGYYDTDSERVGMIAQDVENIMPELVSRGKGMVGGTEVEDYRSMDTSPLIYAVINALKEINTRLEALENA